MVLSDLVYGLVSMDFFHWSDSVFVSLSLMFLKLYISNHDVTNTFLYCVYGLIYIEITNYSP